MVLTKLFQITSKTRQGIPRILKNYFKNQTQGIPEILENYFKNKHKGSTTFFKLRVLQKQDMGAP